MSRERLSLRLRWMTFLATLVLGGLTVTVCIEPGPLGIGVVAISILLFLGDIANTPAQ